MRVIYTAIAGEYDSLKEHPPIKGWHFVAFVDDPIKQIHAGWETRKLISFHPDPVRNSKRYKVLAHEFFPDAECSLWMDGNLKIVKSFDLDELADKFLAVNDIALIEHRRRHCIYAEAEACKERRLDDPSIIDRQISRYQEEGYPGQNGLSENLIVLRRHTADVTALNTMWWREICEGSRRDQLSLCYCMWKKGMRHTTMPRDTIYFPYFVRGKHLHPHHRFPFTP